LSQINICHGLQEKLKATAQEKFKATVQKKERQDDDDGRKNKRTSMARPHQEN
jgi:hypothetical protein